MIVRVGFRQVEDEVANRNLPEGLCEYHSSMCRPQGGLARAKRALKCWRRSTGGGPWTGVDVVRNFDYALKLGGLAQGHAGRLVESAGTKVAVEAQVCACRIAAIIP